MQGQTYSIIAILLSFPIFLFISMFASSVQNMSFGSVDKVVADQVHEIGASMEDDFSRGVDISAKRAFLAGTDNVLTSGAGLKNATNSTLWLMTNGTLGGNQSFIMLNNTLADWRSRILAVPTVFSKSLGFSGLGIKSAGFNVNVTVTLSVNVSDNARHAMSNRTVKLSSPVSIQGFEDPVFAVMTNNIVRRTYQPYPFAFYARQIASGSGNANCWGNITFSNSTPDPSRILVTFNASDMAGYAGVVAQAGDKPNMGCYLVGVPNATSAVNSSVIQSGFSELYLDNKTQSVWQLPMLEMARHGYYTSLNGPSMLSRMELNLTPGNGVESFVNLGDLQAAGVQVTIGDSVLDYQYFSPSSPSGVQVRGMPSWFYIDPARASDYNLTALLGT